MIRKKFPACRVSLILVFLVCLLYSFASLVRAVNDNANGDHRVSLSQEEQIWLRSHPDIILGISDNYEPFHVNHPDGSKSGAFVDLLSQLNQRLGTNIQLSLGTLTENLAAVKEGKIEGAFALHPDYIDELGFLKTQPYYKAYPALFARKGLTLESPDDLALKKIVHLKSEYYSRKLIDQYGAGTTIIEVESTLDGLRMIANGDAMCLSVYL